MKQIIESGDVVWLVSDQGKWALLYKGPTPLHFCPGNDDFESATYTIIWRQYFSSANRLRPQPTRAYNFRIVSSYCKDILPLNEFYEKYWMEML